MWTKFHEIIVRIIAKLCCPLHASVPTCQGVEACGAGPALGWAGGEEAAGPRGLERPRVLKLRRGGLRGRADLDM